MIAQAPRDHFGQPHQHRVERRGLGGVDRERVFMADGFRIAAFADLAVEPAAGVHAARLARQRQAPFAEALFEKGFIERRQIADLADPAGMQVALR